MNGDPNKSEVAAAQAYFAFRTREAETKPSFDPSTLTRADILQIALNADEERLALEAKNKELEPKADAYDTFLDATGKYSVGAVAKMLGMGQNKLFRQLRNVGVFIPKGHLYNTPYQQYMHHFEVLPHYFERSDGTQGTSYTTYAQPSGIDFIRKKLGLPCIDPLPTTSCIRNAPRSNEGQKENHTTDSLVGILPMSIQLFNFRGDDVRIIVNESDEPEWVVTDVAKVLGYRDTSNMCRRLDEDEKGTRLEVSQ